MRNKPNLSAIVFMSIVLFVGSFDVACKARSVKDIYLRDVSCRDVGNTNRLDLKMEPDTTPPLDPSNMDIYEMGWEYLVVRWKPSKSSDVAGYIIRYSVEGGDDVKRIDVGDVTEYKLEGLVNGYSYDIKINAYDTSGNVSGGK